MPLRGATVGVETGVLTGVAVTTVAVAVGPMVTVGTAECTCDIGVARDGCVAIGAGVDFGVGAGVGFGVGVGACVGVGVGACVGVGVGACVGVGVVEVDAGVSSKRRAFWA